MRDNQLFRPNETHFDIVFVADFRVGDTDRSSAISALTALASEGYRIGVLSFVGDIPADAFSITLDLAALLNADVQLIAPDVRATCTLLLAHDLRLFRQRVSHVLAIRSEQRLVLCRRGDLTSPQDLAEHMDHCREALGGAVTVGPTAPPIRALLLALDQNTPLTSRDWPPTVLPRDATHDSDPATRSLPTVGYYRSALSRGWPNNEEDIDDVLPNDPRLGLIVRDAPDIHTATLLAGLGPVNFVNNADTHLFFAGADFITTNSRANHDPWPEEVLEALTHGLIPILSSDFHQMFFSSAIYIKHGNIASKAISVWGNAPYKSDLQEAGQELIELCLAPSHLLTRIKALIGAPAARAKISSSLVRRERVVLSITSNGVGMGHLTRQIAIARRLPENVTPVFLSFSQAVGVVEDFGWIGEYLPYHAGPKMDRDYWNNWLADTLEKACDFYSPAAILLDSNLPFDGIGLLRERRPDLPFVWVRRAMWGEGRDLDALERRPWFDAIFEPGEIAAAYDRGATLHDKASVHVVEPIHLFDPHELMPREAALDDLNLPRDATNVLVLPGAMNNEDTSGFWFRMVEMLSKQENVHVTVGTWKITEQVVEWPAGVRVINGYPFSKWFRGFDFAVSTVGYNSFAELTISGVPTVFVPNENPLMDRQDLRAKHAVRNGYGLMLRNRASEFEMRQVIDEISNPVRRTELGRQAKLQATAYPQNGAVTISQQLDLLLNSAIASRPFR